MMNRLLMLGLSFSLLLCGCRTGQPVAQTTPAAPKATPRSLASIKLQEVEASEEILLELTSLVRTLARDVSNLELPGLHGRKLFADEVRVRDLAESGGRRTVPDWPLSLETVNPGQSRDVFGDFQLWQSVLERFEYFETSKFNYVDGTGTEEGWSGHLYFQGRGRLKSGSLARLSVPIETKWVKDRTGNWRITVWETGEMAVQEVEQPFFQEVLDRVLGSSPGALREARDSVVYRLVESHLEQPDGQPVGLPPTLNNGHPSVSVVDLDRDGWDDIYLGKRRGQNLFLRNLGNGRYEETAASYGLDFDGYTQAALFFDADNDGDSDLFLGRRERRSLLLINEGGRFVDKTSDIEGKVGNYVSSVSAADYNNDGLLDLYLCTYASNPLPREDRRIDLAVVESLMTEEQVKTLRELLESKDADPTVNRYSRPNILLKNLGEGRFAVDLNSPDTWLFRSSLQATWNDYDADGDPDLYVANDFAPNNLLRNDNGTLVDVTAESGPGDQGFGMGVAWGDYDADGDDDLYVSNMYSKAGKRITAEIPDVDPRAVESTRGNSLFRNDNGKFQLVQDVARKAGWSYGSQFADLNSDGRLDLVAPNGYYTAPARFEHRDDR